VPNTHLRLEKSGLHGNGHMMMLEQNSAGSAAVIAGLARGARELAGQHAAAGSLPLRDS